MREALDHWPFVMGAYGVGAVAMAWLSVWSYTAMRSAEKRREEMKRK